MKILSIYIISLTSVSLAVLNNRIDHLDSNVGQLLEAYIQNKTTPSSLQNIFDKVRKSGLGYLLGFDISSEQLCKVCPTAIDLMLLERREGMTNIQLSAELAYFCSVLKFKDLDVCLGIFEPAVEVFSYMIDNKKDLTGKFICGLLLDNLNCDNLKRDEWSVTLPKKSTISPPKEVGKNPFKVLHISDIHYDEHYTEGKSVYCEAPICCQNDQADAKNDSDYCPKWSYYVHADSPKRLVEAVFEKAKTYQFDYVYFTGDIVSHRSWSTSPKNNKEVITEILNMAKKVFNKPIFFVLGNHEGHPVDSFAPGNVGALNSSWLYETMFENLPVEQTDDIKETLLKGGYYTTSPREGFRLIIMNDNSCDNQNWWNIFNNRDPYDMLKWMVQVLEKAEKAQELVHILGHIPTRECLTVWSREFNRIVNRFANTIVGQFYGHTHLDEFYVFYNKSNIDQAINVGWNGASVLPDKSNPSFKIYKVDDVTFRVLDADEYYFNLTDANAFSSESSQLIWNKLYSFKEVFQLQNLELSEMDSLVNKMAKNHTLLQTYYKFKHRNSDWALEKPCNDSCLIALLCSIVNTEFGETKKCESLKKIFLQAKNITNN